MARKKIGEILVQAGLLDAAGLRAGLHEQRRWGGQLGRVLVDMGLVSEEALVQALGRQLNFPAINLDTMNIPSDVIDLVPADLAEQHSLVPCGGEGKFLDVAMSDPTNLGIIDELRIRTQLNVRPYLAGPKAIDRALARYYGRGNVSVDRPIGIELDTGGHRRGGDDSAALRDAEIAALQERISRLEALVARDEDVIRKLLGLLVEKKVATREEILERIR